MNIFKDSGGNWVTRDEVIESLREMHDIALAYEKRKDPSLVGWPDARLMLDHIEQHGLPPNDQAHVPLADSGRDAERK